MTRKPGDLPRAVVLFPAGVWRELRGIRRDDTVGVVDAVPWLSVDLIPQSAVIARRLLDSSQENVCANQCCFRYLR